jgi:hypothetical protein
MIFIIVVTGFRGSLDSKRAGGLALRAVNLDGRRLLVVDAGSFLSTD